MIYLDNTATTAVSKAAADAAEDVLRGCFANPGSLYDIGFEAQKLLEDARARVAAAFGCRAGELLFTASGSEANNIAILGAARARRGWAENIVASGYEHPSAANCLKQLEREGYKVNYVRPGQDGRVDAQRIAELADSKTALVCCMSVNNETGARLDVPAIARQVKSKNKRTAVHCDNVQGFIKHPLAADGGIDTVSASAHKIHGPKGIGALLLRPGFHVENLLFGGHQERGLRPGTENVAFARAFAAACDEAGQSRFDPAPLRRRLTEGLARLGDIRINSPDDASDWIFNFSMLGLRSETVLRFLSERGIYLSSGSACSRGERSHTLSAAALPDGVVDSALRVGFGTDNTESDVDALLDALEAARAELLGAMS